MCPHAGPRACAWAGRGRLGEAWSRRRPCNLPRRMWPLVAPQQLHLFLLPWPTHGIAGTTSAAWSTSSSRRRTTGSSRSARQRCAPHPLEGWLVRAWGLWHGSSWAVVRCEEQRRGGATGTGGGLQLSASRRGDASRLSCPPDLVVRACVPQAVVEYWVTETKQVLVKPPPGATHRHHLLTCFTIDGTHARAAAARPLLRRSNRAFRARPPPRAPAQP